MHTIENTNGSHAVMTSKQGYVVANIQRLSVLSGKCKNNIYCLILM
jgi:hypothetical protein